MNNRLFTYLSDLGKFLCLLFLPGQAWSKSTRRWQYTGTLKISNKWCGVFEKHSQLVPSMTVTRNYANNLHKLLLKGFYKINKIPKMGHDSTGFKELSYSVIGNIKWAKNYLITANLTLKPPEPSSLW